MIENYLKKLQELQRDAINSGVTIEIKNYYDKEDNYPWLAVTAYFDCGDGEFTEGRNYTSVHLYGNMYKDEKDNEEKQAEAYAKIENLVKKAFALHQAKQRFVKAYERAIEFQKACRFSKASVNVDSQFCESNFKENNLDAWTVKVYVHYKKSGEEESTLRMARWAAWDEDAKFYCELEDIEKALVEEGIINNK
jgi:hypothetical protein